jgi:hypothetical protein
MIAGAMACHGVVRVLAPSTTGTHHRDGAFDVVSVGTGDPEHRGEPLDRECDSLDDYDFILVVGDPDPTARELLAGVGPDHVFALPVGHESWASRPDAVAGIVIPFYYDGAPTVTGVPVQESGFFVPVNPIASTAPLSGVGARDYLLVLEGEASRDTSRGAVPGSLTGVSPLASWLIARFPRLHTVTVGQGALTVWHSRAPLGTLPVGTRMDLWRLMAFARATVDLLPGPLVARECIESLLLGTPLVIPNSNVAREHLRGGAGLPFEDLTGLLDAVRTVMDEDVARSIAEQGLRYAQGRFGSSRTLIDSFAAVLRSARTR